MRVLYLKKWGFYALIPVSDKEKETISEIVMVLSTGDRIHYRKHRSLKIGQNIFQTRFMFGCHIAKINFILSGSTEQDNENIENIISHAFLPDYDFCLRFIRGVNINDKWVIVVYPKLYNKKATNSVCLSAH